MLTLAQADPETWSVPPFKLTRDGDKLYGRGTTDCLGHVALLTNLMLQLAERRPKLSVNVTAVFIACEVRHRPARAQCGHQPYRIG